MSITQTTELGTLYTPTEVRAIADYAHEHGMALHMDGARLWNASAALGVPFREFTVDAGVDILSLGGTKIGALAAEAVVVLDPTRVDGLVFLRKTTMQLSSKMRFLSAQLLALFEGGLGIAAATQANAMAARLPGALEELGLPGLGFSQATQANAVFAILDNAAADRIREKVRFYDWDRAAGEVRWMTAFDTTEADVDTFVEVIRAELSADAPRSPGHLMQEYVPTSVAQHGSALARTTPDIEQVREGVWAIPLPLPHPGGVESTLCYSIADDDGGVHLVDPGWDTDDNLARLETGLAIVGFGLGDVRSVTATHFHPDHLGLAARLRVTHDIPVAMHRAEHEALSRPLYPDAEATITRWGVPEDRLAEVHSVALPRSQPSGLAADVVLDDGVLLPISGRVVRVVATPGHTAGSICLHDETDGLFFSGDHVLPIINPGLGLGGFLPGDDPLGAALDSYARMAEFDDAEVCPGHGYRFRGLAVRAGQIADRHRRRSAEIGAIAATDPDATVWQIAEQVSWTDGWQNLAPFMRLSALSQTEMHLEHLRRGTLDG